MTINTIIYLIGAIIGITWSVIIFVTVGGWELLGIFLMLWGNNISISNDPWKKNSQ